MAGKLQHATLGIPGGKGLFSPIYNAMKGDPDPIVISPWLKQALQDWLIILHRIASRPMSVLELHPGPPAFIGYVDASGFGAGRVWISGTDHIPLIAWRMPFPLDIEQRLESHSNPNVDITNSNLEMAGVLLQWLVLEQEAPTTLQHKHIEIFSDNTPTVAWATCLHSSKSKVAGHLLCALAIRQHAHRASPLLTISIAGKDNNMVDVALQSFRHLTFITSNSTFSQTFTSLFPPATATLLEGMPLGRKALLAGDIMSAWQTIVNGVVVANSKKREKYWNYWEQYCTAFNKHPHLTDCSPTQQILILTAFTARVQTGYYGKGETVKVQSVQDHMLAAISKTTELGGQPSPIYKAEKTYKVSVTRLVEGMRQQDLQAVVQIAVPISIPNEVLQVAQASAFQKQLAVGNLTIIAFFYLLRVGEYTKPKFVIIDGERTRATCTVQF
jgi:hypothetical protein